MPGKKHKQTGKPLNAEVTPDLTTPQPSPSKEAHPEKAHIPLAERSYLKTLNSKVNFSRAGKSFVMSMAKPDHKSK